MPRRLLRMMLTMAGVWAIYWVYSFVAVPLIEPAAVATPQAPAGGPSPTVVDGPKRQIERLRPYFQPGDWELKDPIVMENPTFTLLMQGYRALPDKQIEIKPCTMIFFPDGPGEVQGRPARAVILQAPGGAVLDFDGECDLSRAKVGRLLGGRLVGEIKIHGNLSRGAAAGDPSGELHAETHDLQLNQERIWTPHEVQFTLGPNHGSGRDLQILLVQANAGSRSAKHAMPRGIEAIELLRDVHLTAMLGNSGPLSGGPLGGGPLAAKKLGGNQLAGGANQPPGQPAPPAAPTPVDIVCQGAFRFDMIDNVATFEKQVRVVRTNPIGPADDMACDLLAIHFTKSAADVTNAILAGGPPNPAGPLPPGAAAAPPTEAKAPRAGGSLTATLLEARGNPVIVRAPSMQGEARGEHLQYKIQSGSLLLEGDRPIQLNYGPQQVVARMMRYTPGPDGQPAEVLCEGAGQYNGVMPSDPTQHCAARWTKQLSLRPNDGKQLLSVLGDAKLVYGNLGSLAGDEIWFWLAPAPPAPDNRVPGATPQQLAINPTGALPQAPNQVPTLGSGPQLGRTTTRFQPHSMLARGHVHIDATQLIGRTGQLEVWFQQEDGPANRAAQPAVPGFPGQAAAIPNNANNNANNGGGNANNPANAGEPAPVSRYAVTGKLTRVQFVMHDGKPTLRDVAISGKVAMHEELPPGSPDKPFHLSGDDVQLLSADAPDSTLAVTGNPAHVDARGLGLTGTNIQLDKASNRLWVDGQGEMIVMVAAPRKNADAASIAQPAPPPAEQPLTIGFTHGLKFDGRLARFGGPVVARTEQQRLDTAEMTAELTEPIDFSRPRGAGRERPAIGQIICQGGVRLESRSLEEGHVTSIERLQTDNLVVNQQTGEIKSSGAGWVSSIRLRSPNADNMPFNRGAAAAKPAGDRPGLDYLRVRYQQGISGNIQRREVTFADQVSCIFGPVHNWTDEIDSLRADELSPDQILMTCDQLTAYDTGTPNGADPAGARSDLRPEARTAPRGALPVGLMGGAAAGGAGGKSLELQAIGNARVAGQTFTAQGDRLTYASDKQLLVLEGAGQGDAHLWQKSPGGDPSSHAVARKILYWRASNRVQVLDIRLGDFSQLGGPINPRQREPHPRGREPLPTAPAIRKDGT